MWKTTKEQPKKTLSSNKFGYMINLEYGQRF